MYPTVSLNLFVFQTRSTLRQPLKSDQKTPQGLSLQMVVRGGYVSLFLTGMATDWV